MTKRIVLLLCILTLGLGTLAFADEGMWLFNHFPVDKVKAKYGFAPDQAWLDHVRLSSARAPNGSSSFVSADGLDLHQSSHRARLRSRSLHQRQGLHEERLLRSHAGGRAQVPGRGIRRAGRHRGRDRQGERRGQARHVHGGRRQGTARRDGEPGKGVLHQRTCAAMSLPSISGAMYNLYKYKKYDDVRLVFAPEFDIAFFGGDPDNFEYPRYDLDISFFRAYENGQPAKTTDYLKWSPTGVNGRRPGVCLRAIPAARSRLFTMDQLEFLRDVQYPWQLKSLARRVDMLQKFSARVGRERPRSRKRSVRPAERLQGVQRLPGRTARQGLNGQEGCR